MPRPGAAAYHLQQAAEKLLKSLLILTGQALRRTHDLDELAAILLPRLPRFTNTINALRPLTIWNVAFRYPPIEDAPDPPPSPDELAGYLALLAAFASDIEAMTRTV